MSESAAKEDVVLASTGSDSERIAAREEARWAGFLTSIAIFCIGVVLFSCIPPLRQGSVFYVIWLVALVGLSVGMWLGISPAMRRRRLARSANVEQGLGQESESEGSDAAQFGGSDTSE
ncbi:MAG: hypothetical protein LBR21_00325 [Propionibacteriaceae bacterium]|jgi:hypothetical protein|nr:hypothetical protein [Propionibacteriaceae bacterium]